MNVIKTIAPVRAAVLGSLVADAAGMGLHWIYSQGKIAQIVGDNSGIAEFLEPDAANYHGVPSFFAHPARRAGDSSNYGEYLYVTLRATSETGFDPALYLREFQTHFGPGGTYVGYVDTPMRETLFNVARVGKELHDRVLRAPSSLDEGKRADAAHYIARYFFDVDAEGLKERVRTPLKLKQWSPAELAETDRLIDDLSRELGATGPDDDQLPALTRSAVLAHFYAGVELDEMVERAVRITNNNDVAVGYAVFMARVLRDLYQAYADRGATAVSHQAVRATVEEHLSVLDAAAADLVRESLAYAGLDHRGATKRFGAACHLNMGVPVALHIVLNTNSFAEAVRANILASGDNCGRAMLLGALAGLLYGTGAGAGGGAGIPEEWMARTSILPRARRTEGGQALLGE